MPEITVKRLIEQLEEFPDDMPVGFGSNILGIPLTFGRVKSRGNVVQIELNEQFEKEGTYTIEWDGAVFGLDGPHLNSKN